MTIRPTSSASVRFPVVIPPPVARPAPPRPPMAVVDGFDRATAAAAPSLRAGSTGKDVEAWQNHLVALGYLSKPQKATGPGVFGPATAEATKQFQREHHLNVSGAVGPATRASMVKALAARGTATKDPDWAGVMSWKKVVDRFAPQFGVPANLVLAMMKLESNGQNLPPNGSGAVGPMQITSVWDGLGDRFDPVQNIKMACRILKVLKDENPSYGWDGAVRAYFSGSPLPSDTRSDGFNTVNQYLATVKANRAELEGKPASTALERGMQGAAVRAWQAQLVRAGYMTQAQVDTGPGVFGPITEAATKAFQRDHGLNVSGRVGSATQAKMNGVL